MRKRRRRRSNSSDRKASAKAVGEALRYRGVAAPDEAAAKAVDAAGVGKIRGVRSNVIRLGWQGCCTEGKMYRDDCSFSVAL